MFALLYSLVGLDLVTSKIIAYIFGLTVNFILERIWVFGDSKSKAEIERVSIRYVILSVVNLGIDTLIVWGLNNIGITPYIGQFVSSGFFTVWNYVWYKIWVFAGKGEPGKKRPASPQIKRPKRVKHLQVAK